MTCRDVAVEIAPFMQQRRAGFFSLLRRMAHHKCSLHSSLGVTMGTGLNCWWALLGVHPTFYGTVCNSNLDM